MSVDDSIGDDAPNRFLNGRLLLRQPREGHRAGTDAILLAACAGDVNGTLVDAGAGVGAAGLAAALRSPGCQLTMIEIDAATVDLARQNVGLNGLETRARVVACDVLSAAARRAAGLASGMADVVIANPPWLTPGRVRASPDAARSLAHVAAEAHDERRGLDGWLRAIAALLKPGGRMALIHRADALAPALNACRGRLVDLAILPIHPRDDRPAIRVIVAGRKGARGPTRLLPGLVLHEADGRFTARAQSIHRGEAWLDMG